MGRVSYFSAVIGRTRSSWRALDVDVDEAESLDELGSQLRAVANGGCVLAVLEHEDEWFALVRVDDDDEPRAFVSDLEAAQHGHYAQLLAPVGDVELDEYAELRSPSAATSLDDDSDQRDDDLDGTSASDEPDPLLAEAERDLADAAVDPPLPPAWAGDPGVLADHGVEAVELVELVLAAPNDPGSVVAEIGERCGFDDLIEALR